MGVEPRGRVASVSSGSQARGSKRQLEGADGEGKARGWVEDEEGKEERHQQLRQEKGRSQVQLEEAALEGAAAVRTMCWLVVVGCAGAKLPRAGSLVRDGVVSRECVRR